MIPNTRKRSRRDPSRRLDFGWLSSHHPVAFWFGCLAVASGVHLPMHFRLAGVAMDLPMKIGMRGTGSGTVAAGSKAGGILGAMLGVAGLFDSFLVSALVIAAPMTFAGVMLWRSGVETSGRELETIQRAFEALE